MITDGSSVSIGAHSRGLLRAGAPLPFSGEGYLMPPRWQQRRRNFATDELVGLLVRAARKVRTECGGGTLGIADLSPRGGGQTPEHLSHHSGRDVDLLLYAVDLEGHPMSPTLMIHFDAKGNSVSKDAKEATDAGVRKASAPATRAPDAGAAPTTDASVPGSEALEQRRLDLVRNWSLVKHLVTDPEVPVQWIFVGKPIIQLLLAHAKRRKEPEYIIERAAMVMHQPGDAQAHMDHMHVRIFCPLDDRGQGCIDRGPPRFLKKTIKYRDRPPASLPLPRPLPQLSLLPLGLLGP